MHCSFLLPLLPLPARFKGWKRKGFDPLKYNGTAERKSQGPERALPPVSYIRTTFTSWHSGWGMNGSTVSQAWLTLFLRFLPHDEN